MSAKIKHLKPLVNHLLDQNTPETLEKTLRDLLSAKELADMANRLQIIEMLQQGIPQRQIADKLGVGIATVTRGSLHLKRESQ